MIAFSGKEVSNGIVDEGNIINGSSLPKGMDLLKIENKPTT